MASENTPFIAREERVELPSWAPGLQGISLQEMDMAVELCVTNEGSCLQ